MRFNSGKRWFLAVVAVLLGLATEFALVQPGPDAHAGGAAKRSGPPLSAESKECLECHGERDFTTSRNGKDVSLYIDGAAVGKSVHGGQNCTACHSDLAGASAPHAPNPKPVNCGRCHTQANKYYTQSLHGEAAEGGEELAPRCKDCHGSHSIPPVGAPDSKVSKFNIPFTCGKCHKEGTEVSTTYNIPQQKILEHYSFSVHGEGLYKKGLIVTAVCTDCHTAHFILPHTDQRSSISKQNIAKMCQKCHGMIEQVHQKVIRGELWEKAPNQVPVCVDCHAPHKARKVYYELGMADRNCLQCHSDPGLVSEKDPKRSMHVNAEAMKGGAHERVACAQCHNGVSAAEKRPCATQTMKVDCSTCHAKAVDAYKTGIHGKLSGRGDPQAPECRDCHGTHDIRKRTDTKSSTYPTGVPNLCGKCHREGEKAAVRYKGSQHEIVKHYQTSIHGKGLLQSGLVVTATCTDCHDSHKVLPGADPASTVNKNNIAATCAKCHNGIYEKFSESVHHPDERDRAKGKEYPVCSDCHSAHQISRTDYEGFKFEIMSQCGRCHQAVTKSYFDTFHGKVVKLGYTKTAKCYDCHGSHDIQGIFSPKSKLSRDNIVQTCGKCHPGSHRRFAGYLTHATHHDRVKYPILFYTFWAMSILLIGVFSVFGIHTMMWLPRSLKARKRHALRASEWSGTEKQVLRFSRLERQLHVLVIVSFLGLALTGMTLKFSYLGWAQVLSRLLGGFESAGVIHRICAVVTFFYFGAHLFELYRKRRRIGASWRDFLIGKLSMVPNMTDLKELVGTLKWFVGRGPKPAYGRWTYWEKFDYLAVFWGVAVIGSTGLVLWFPAFFTRFLPGWSINVATVVHSDEALLAAGFIFTVHFFNTHFRPEKFPMDPVIFTGRIPLEEFKEERPREYAELAASGELEKKLVDPLPGIVVRAMKMFGAAALFTGLFLVVLIIYAEVFGYK